YPVTLANGTRLDRSEVTNHRYHLCVVQGRCTAPADFGVSTPGWVDRTANGPVVMVSLIQARTFCAWIGRRLPTRAQPLPAHSTNNVLYLLKERGREWTTTKNDYGAFVLVGHYGAGRPSVTAAVQTETDFDISFRCAQSPRNG